MRLCMVSIDGYTTVLEVYEELLYILKHPLIVELYKKKVKKPHFFTFNGELVSYHYSYSQIKLIIIFSSSPNIRPICYHLPKTSLLLNYLPSFLPPPLKLDGHRAAHWP